MLLDLIEILCFLGALIVISPLLGNFIANIFTENKPMLYPCLGWLEKLCYRAGGIDEAREMHWRTYGKSLLFFNFIGFIFLFTLQLVQGYLPLNPEHFQGVSWPLAFNTAASFTTNTNWQAYAGETTLSYLTQMLGLTSQNFLSAATGLSLLVVLTRGIKGNASATVGNFWRDLVRSIVYLLLPLSIILAIFLVTQGVIQSFSPYATVSTLENAEQIIPFGPVASQVAIKQLGTNGGGFFNANSAHPFENPSPITNWLQNFAILLIPAASVHAYGIMIGSKREGWVLFSVMLGLFIFGLGLGLYAESIPNPSLHSQEILEGIETRFGSSRSILWTMSTSATSNGSVNSMLSSLPPLSGGVALFNIMLGELIFGGVGVGLCSMIMFILLTVFLSGLMVGRTPEYQGKKIEKKEMQWVLLAILLPSLTILVGSAVASVSEQGLKSLGNLGPHGLSELLYAFSSTAANNGSAFSGFNANTFLFNIVLGVVMLLGRASIALPSLALAGLLVQKKIAPKSIGSFSTDSTLFAFLLAGTIIVMGGLTFFPALSLGPILEHLLMLEGKTL